VRRSGGVGARSGFQSVLALRSVVVVRGIGQRRI